MLVSNKRFYPLTEEMGVAVKHRPFLFPRVEDETDTGRMPAGNATRDGNPKRGATRIQTAYGRMFCKTKIA